MTQDDAHIFCTQGADGRRAARRCSTSCSTCCATTASTTSTSSCRPSPRARRSAPTRSGRRRPRRCAPSPRPTDLELVMDEGGGAFYGPKISVQARTRSAAPGRCRRSSSTSSCRSASTCEYVGADNERHRPIMIHRALFGSIERFFAVLVEHYAGAFPAWLAPVQVTVLPVADRHDDVRARGRGRAAGRRASASRWSTRTPTRSARGSGGPRLEKVPYVLVVGDDDVEHGTVGVNARGSDAARARRRASTTSSSGSRAEVDARATVAVTRDPRAPLGGVARDVHRRRRRRSRAPERPTSACSSGSRRPIPTTRRSCSSATSTRSR